MRALWARKETQYGFVTNLMPRERFDEMYKCFVFEEGFIEELEQLIRQHMSIVRQSSNTCVVDESMVAFKGRDNPHRIWIPRKPHPHGVKVNASGKTSETLEMSDLIVDGCGSKRRLRAWWQLVAISLALSQK